MRRRAPKTVDAALPNLEPAVAATAGIAAGLRRTVGKGALHALARQAISAGRWLPSPRRTRVAVARGASRRRVERAQVRVARVGHLRGEDAVPSGDDPLKSLSR